MAVLVCSAETLDGLPLRLAEMRLMEMKERISKCQTPEKGLFSSSVEPKDLSPLH